MENWDNDGPCIIFGFLDQELGLGLGPIMDRVKWLFILSLGHYSRMVIQLLIGFIFVMKVWNFRGPIVGGFLCDSSVWDECSSLYFWVEGTKFVPF